MVMLAAKQAGKDIGDFAEFIKSEDGKAMFLHELKEKQKEFKLNGFEIPHKVHLTTEMFTPMNGVLTPSMKLVRTTAKKVFIKEIKEMYGGSKLQGEDEE